MSESIYQSIIRKARKVAELASRGEAGEATAARQRLDEIMAKYKLTTDDLFLESKKEYDFSFSTEEEELLLLQIIYTVCQTKKMTHGSFRNMDTNKKIRGRLWFMLTPYQYAEVSEMYDFHVRQLRKEIKAIKEQIVEAYINKHRIFPPNHENTEEEPTSMAELQRLSSIMNLLSDDVVFHKALNN